MAVKCKSCGEESVVWDDYNGGAGQQVCSNCGVVYSDGYLESDIKHSTLVDELGRFSRKGLPDDFLKLQCNRIPEGLKAGKNQIKTICSAMKLSDELLVQALALFDRVYNIYIRCHVETKIVMSVWCVYIICRQAGLPITSYYMSQLTGYAVCKIFQNHSECLEKLGIELEQQEITELIETTLKLELDSGIKYTENIIHITRDIIMLCKDLWLVDGRNPYSLILCAFYFAWQSEDYNKRKKVIIAKLCKRQAASRLCKKRLTEFNSLLCELAQGIPWIGNVTHDNIAYYVKDVLKYQRSLTMDAMKRAKEELEKSEYLQDEIEQHSVTMNTSGVKLLSDSASDELKTEGTSKFVALSDSTSSEVTSGHCGSTNVHNIDVKDETSMHDESVSSVFNLSKEESFCSSENEESDVKFVNFQDGVVPRSVEENFEQRKRDIEKDNMFMPPSFKKARRRSVEREEILSYMEKGREAMYGMALKLSEASVKCEENK